MAAKINEKAIEKTKEEAIAWVTRDLSGLLANFARNFTRKIVETYLENCEKIETEEERNREKEQTDRIMADAGWFPGDCCD